MSCLCRYQLFHNSHNCTACMRGVSCECYKSYIGIILCTSSVIEVSEPLLLYDRWARLHQRQDKCTLDPLNSYFRPKGHFGRGTVSFWSRLRFLVAKPEPLPFRAKDLAKISVRFYGASLVRDRSSSILSFPRNALVPTIKSDEARFCARKRVMQ